jgi:hypothetical protein
MSTAEDRERKQKDLSDLIDRAQILHDETKAAAAAGHLKLPSNAANSLISLRMAIAAKDPQQIVRDMVLVEIGRTGGADPEGRLKLPEIPTSSPDTIAIEAELQEDPIFCRFCEDLRKAKKLTPSVVSKYLQRVRHMLTPEYYGELLTLAQSSRATPDQIIASVLKGAVHCTTRMRAAESKKASTTDGTPDAAPLNNDPQ